MTMQMDMTCPYCGKKNELHDSVTDPGARPSPGDVSMCITCGSWGVFTECDIRKPTPHELDDIANTPECRRASAAWQRVVKANRTLQ
jgi:uncharacterized Zn finger protein